MKTCSCSPPECGDKVRGLSIFPGRAMVLLVAAAVACAVAIAACSSARRLSDKAEHQSRLETFHRALGNMTLVGDYHGAMGLAQEMLFLDSTFLYLDDYHQLYQCGVRTGLVNTASVALHFGRWRASRLKDPSKRDAALSAFEGWLAMLRHRAAAGEVTVLDGHLGDLLSQGVDAFPCLPVGGVAAVQRRVKTPRGYQVPPGVVTVQVTVNEQGRVVDCAVVGPLAPVADQAVIEAAYRSSFFPAFVKGKPVGATVLVEVPVRAQSQR
ncbi:MAG: TonB family protein [Calditrichaeota bacterium]|nr:TonB family protein [Calditrichota bacterium]